MAITATRDWEQQLEAFVKRAQHKLSWYEKGKGFPGAAWAKKEVVYRDLYFLPDDDFEAGASFEQYATDQGLMHFDTLHILNSYPKPLYFLPDDDFEAGELLGSMLMIYASYTHTLNLSPNL
jgi:hypothetical protein